MISDLSGKRAVITGAAAGLGRATAELFIAQGAKVVVSDRDGDGAAEAAAALGPNAVAATCDVTVAAQIAETIDVARSSFGGLDVMVNNAGIEIGKPLTETTEEEFDALMKINVTGVFLGIKAAVPALAEAGGGSIVNMASVAGIGGAPLLGAYCASKGAVVRLTEVAAIELKAANIRVNAVCPAFIDTAMVDRLVSPFEAAVGMPFGEVLKVKQGRIGTAAEVAEMVAFLASDDSSFTTGSQYVLDGGLVAGLL
ncbi:Short-chain dehydrogenase/reductase SDR [Patulibacter medicamentivorans]|uniref:Short-chain dehydrogenase/reductase SDR n=1 Tax=Patulibacter medicamentivorans TaxID=1097667 RepID=H0E7Q4_9ACTN|nr:SDR family oxidoreductase [Patulibacter medicamentivorans]EHN10328.1 Short-chain dehydrogenase/reductase SDR [Patulibacter medicamentivorans]